MRRCTTGENADTIMCRFPLLKNTFKKALFLVTDIGTKTLVDTEERNIEACKTILDIVKANISDQ